MSQNLHMSSSPCGICMAGSKEEQELWQLLRSSSSIGSGSAACWMDLLDLEPLPNADRHEARHEFRFAEITGEVGGLVLVLVLVVVFLSLCNLNIFKLNEYFELLRVGTFIFLLLLFIFSFC